MKIFWLISLFILQNLLLRAQNQEISGFVHDENGQPVPFASIFKENANMGTSANNEGQFRLSLPKGEHVLMVRAVGYTPSRQIISIPLSQPLRILLHKEAYVLDEVVVGSGEDPAYAIIRKAIKNREKHLHEGVPYQALTYIKTLHRLQELPKRILGIKVDIPKDIGLDSNGRGVVYLSESESRIRVNPPDQYSEELISSKISGNNRAFSFNRAADLKWNLYENLQPILEGLSARPFVSPIANQALRYYRYQLMGSSEENGMMVYKIKVIPKRADEPLYKGNIYIAEGTWRIYSLDLLLDKQSGIQLVDSMHLRQQFIQVAKEHWLPSGIQLTYSAAILGIRIAGYSTAFFNEYQLTPDSPHRSFREVLRIADNANQKDSLYWAIHRQVPLTTEERLDYIRKDSLQQLRSSKAYQDSMDRENNRFNPISFLLSGYDYQKRSKQANLSFDSPIRSFLFNSVEGLAVNYGIHYSKRLDTMGLNNPNRQRHLLVSGNIRYGFKNRRLNGSLGLELPMNNGSLTLAGGSEMADLNNLGSIPTLFNSVSTLFFGRNEQKLYERRFGRANWAFVLPGNIQFSAGANWEDRTWLPNSTYYTFSNRNKKHLTSNNPFLPNQDVALFPSHQAMTVQASLSYDFGNRYETYPSGRQYLPSGYPVLSLNYVKGIPDVLGSDVDYDVLSANLQKQGIGLGLYGKCSFSLTAGKFMNNASVYYPDYQHFKGSDLLVYTQEMDRYLLLDYYQYSTAGKFAEAHVEYNLSGLLSSKVPGLRNLHLEEIVGGHYLHTDAINHYGELNAGLKWRLLRVMYARSFSNENALKQKEAVRIGLFWNIH